MIVGGHELVVHNILELVGVGSGQSEVRFVDDIRIILCRHYLIKIFIEVIILELWDYE
jgi:hypothetical protein